MKATTLMLTQFSEFLSRSQPLYSRREAADHIPMMSVEHSFQASLPLGHYPMTVAPGWGQSRHKYSGKDFKVIEDEAIECPAGHRMDRQEVRYNRVGDMQMVFGVKPTICQDCPLIRHCHADRSDNTRGRRILVTRVKLPTPPPLAETPDIFVQPNSTATTIGTGAIIWRDIPATQFRRNLKGNLERNQIEIESASTNPESMLQKRQLLTRHQRAHRRLSWEQRLKRNQLKRKSMNLKVQLFGISPGLAQFLKHPCGNDYGHL